MKKTLIASILSLVIFFTLGMVLVAAQGSPPTGGGNPPVGGGDATTGGGNPPVNAPINIKLDNPFRVKGDLFDLMKAIVNDIILPVGGVLAVLAFIYSGFLYVTAQGNETKLKTAHTALLYTSIGTAVLLGSWALANVIKNTINQLM